MDVSSELKNIKKKDKEIDDALPELHDAVIQIKEISIKMRDELDLHDEILKKNVEKTDDVKVELYKVNRGTMEIIEKEDTGDYNNCCYFVLFIFFLIILFIFISLLLS